MAPPDFEKLLVANLKALVENGRLIKVMKVMKISSFGLQVRCIGCCTSTGAYRLFHLDIALKSLIANS